MKPKLTREDVLNWWLQKYHNVTVDDVKLAHPEAKTDPEWFKFYPVTKDQHDEWHEWFISTLAKERRMSKKLVRKLSSLDYLDCAPYYLTQ